MSKIRKAVAAFGGTFVGAGLAYLKAAGTFDAATVAQAVGAGVAAGLLSAIAVYMAPANAVSSYRG